MSRMAVRPRGQAAPDECTPLITDAEPEDSSYSTTGGCKGQGENSNAASIAYRLYISHFLSTWNSRVFEFGAVLYLASIYPGTLLPMSGYALSRGLAAFLIAPAVGHYIDVSNRLQVVRLSIVLQRLVVAASCAIFFLLAIRLPTTRVVNISLLVISIFLACIEKLCSVMNMVSVERDWVVIVAGEDHGSLRSMNAQIRRIDLICKLIGPLFIALIDGISTETAILVNFAMNICSVVVEYFSIAKVYYEVPELQEPKRVPNNGPPNVEMDQQSLVTRIWTNCSAVIQKALGDFGSYVRHRVFLPSFAGALLYLTVLSFSGQMVTWLLSVGYDSTQIAIARTLSVAFEVLATWVAPWLMGRIGPTRAGLWLASWQVVCLAAGTFIFWKFHSYALMSASGLVGGTILSRVGLRGLDLCVQILVQEGVEAEARGSFSSTEAAWQSLFEICSYASTIVFSRPDQFRWPALISVVAVGVAALLYAISARIQRGHLVHLPKCVSQRHSRERGFERILSSSVF